jgi:hypothetical protein
MRFWKIIEGEKPLAAYLFTKNEERKSRSFSIWFLSVVVLLMIL